MNLTKKLEYMFIGFSVVGAVSIMYKQHLACFVAPATMSLVFNLVNRQKEITKANIQIAKLEQSITSYGQFHAKEISTVQTSLLSIKSSELDVLGNSVEKLDSDVSFLKDNIFNVAAEYRSNFTEISTNNGRLHTLIASIKSQLENVSDDLPEIYRQIHALNCDIPSQIIETVDVAIGNKKIDQSIQKAVRARIDAIQQVLLQNRPSEPINGRVAGRKVFLEALANAENSLIFVCPWITEAAIDDRVKKLILSALRKGVIVNVGWGNLNDVGGNIDNLTKYDLLLTAKASGGSEWDKKKYGAVEWFYDLEKQYPGLVKMKVLGTHSKYLICDHKFALVGSHNFMASSDTTSWGVSQEGETGLKTTNPQTIDNLIRAFNQVRTASKKSIARI
jgi:phosphatidylserine/phosphatidylglycerophosphate/cardiolipin synthase-like enzyme